MHKAADCPLLWGALLLGGADRGGAVSHTHCLAPANRATGQCPQGPGRTGSRPRAESGCPGGQGAGDGGRSGRGRGEGSVSTGSSTRSRSLCAGVLRRGEKLLPVSLLVSSALLLFSLVLLLVTLALLLVSLGKRRLCAGCGVNSELAGEHWLVALGALQSVCTPSLPPFCSQASLLVSLSSSSSSSQDSKCTRGVPDANPVWRETLDFEREQDPAPSQPFSVTPFFPLSSPHCNGDTPNGTTHGPHGSSTAPGAPSSGGAGPRFLHLACLPAKGRWGSGGKSLGSAVVDLWVSRSAPTVARGPVQARVHCLHLSCLSRFSALGGIDASSPRLPIKAPSLSTGTKYTY